MEVVRHSEPAISAGYVTVTSDMGAANYELPVEVCAA